METLHADLPTLFAQLGLPTTPAAIRAFIASHVLPPGVALPDAAFWRASQADFLREALAEDSEWAEVVDELALLLSRES
ncbi:DUF2789 domain-containing protein [Chitinilyticum aquatile]|uniref:DUF2789 domain-containing protein n=1 Tax=Chitinilyticum aquatile TaxID=362520 RepID=UPI0003F813CC|nr:DUF2789 domain-containing protein [Chitinilyticum aquatile]